jgi:plastocyanin
MMKLAHVAAAGLLACSLSPAAAQQPAQLVVQLWSFGIGPSPIQLAAGRPVTLSFVNRSGSGHDFTAPGFFQHARIIAGAAPDGEIELRPHETRTITLIPAAGTYQAHCSHFLHKQMGMTDLIVVG